MIKSKHNWEQTSPNKHGLKERSQNGIINALDLKLDQQEYLSLNPFERPDMQIFILSNFNKEMNLRYNLTLRINLDDRPGPY